jgi:hypothetical protein
VKQAFLRDEYARGRLVNTHSSEKASDWNKSPAKTATEIMSTPMSEAEDAQVCSKTSSSGVKIVKTGVNCS